MEMIENDEEMLKLEYQPLDTAADDPDDHLIRLAQALKVNKSLTGFSVIFCALTFLLEVTFQWVDNFTHKSLKAIMKALAKHHSITKILFSNCKFSPKRVQNWDFFSILTQKALCLKTVTLDEIRLCSEAKNALEKQSGPFVTWIY
jgi:hypothetical protein